ncbi:MAG: hypothetical protein C4288_06670 [Leptolyngbya sp. ERB_1_1]
MLMTTTDVIQNAVIESYLGVVTAEVVYGTNALKDFFASIRDLIGGRTAGYERVFQQAQQNALAELQKRAQNLGADAIVGIGINTGTINMDQSGVLLLITAVGTAVKIH